MGGQHSLELYCSTAAFWQSPGDAGKCINVIVHEGTMSLWRKSCLCLKNTGIPKKLRRRQADSGLKPTVSVSTWCCGHFGAGSISDGVRMASGSDAHCAVCSDLPTRFPRVGLSFSALGARGSPPHPPAAPFTGTDTLAQGHATAHASALFGLLVRSRY